MKMIPAEENHRHVTCRADIALLSHVRVAVYKNEESTPLRFP